MVEETHEMKLDRLTDFKMVELDYNHKLSKETLQELLSPGIKFKENYDRLNDILGQMIESKDKTNKEIIDLSHQAVGVIYELFPSLHAITEAVRNARYEMTGNQDGVNLNGDVTVARITDYGSKNVEPLYACGACGDEIFAPFPTICKGCGYQNNASLRGNSNE